jgi:Glycosyl hydrolases family 43
VGCFRADYARHGWERRGEENLGAPTGPGFQEGPWFEGSWMTRHAGTYYLQYAAPGTEFRGYADGVYTAPSPRGPFTYAPYSPFFHKPTGFIAGAGHSAISVKHDFEGRLGLFPAEFDAGGQLHVNTLFGDFLSSRRRSETTVARTPNRVGCCCPTGSARKPPRASRASRPRTLSMKTSEPSGAHGRISPESG